MNNICSFCSLLCDSSALQQACPRRNEILEQLEFVPIVPVCSSRNSTERLEILEHTRQILSMSSNIHVAGKICCVETARASLTFAQHFNASIDGSSSPIADAAGRSLARSGAYFSTLSETRSIAECVIVVGSDRLLTQLPMLPSVLKKHPEAPAKKNDPMMVVLMGDFSKESIDAWSEHYDHLIYFPTPLEVIPEALIDWFDVLSQQSITTCGVSEESEVPVLFHTDSGSVASATPGPQSDQLVSTVSLMRRLENATYTSVLWGAGDPPSINMELWLDRLVGWLAKMNECKRAGMVQISGLENTFRQVSSWTTGYPTAVRSFDNGWGVDVNSATTDDWLSQYRDDVNAVLVVIDESVDGWWARKSAEQVGFRGHIILLSGLLANAEVAESGLSAKLPIALPGFDMNANMHRGDGVIMAYVKGEILSDRVPASEWLKGLYE